MSDDTPQAGMVTTAQASKLLMISVQHVGKLVKEGVLPKAGDNRYPLAGLVQGYIRYLRDEARRSTKSAAASRVTDARAREIELRVARQENLLIETAEAVAVLDEILGGLKSDLSGIAARATRDVDLRRKIDSEINGALERASARLQSRADALRASGEAAAAEPEDDAG